MVDIALEKMTFEEFIELADEDAGYELVDGKLERLMSPTMRHSGSQTDLGYYIRRHLGDGFRGFIGVELDFPTIPHYGRRGDIVYLAPEHVTPEDWVRGYPLHPPDLVIEIVSPDDETRDYETKHREYARVGIPHYWIVDPARRTVELHRLGDAGAYVLDRRLGADDILTSSLFPGLKVPLRRILR